MTGTPSPSKYLQYHWTPILNFDAKVQSRSSFAALMRTWNLINQLQLSCLRLCRHMCKTFSYEWLLQHCSYKSSCCPQFSNINCSSPWFQRNLFLRTRLRAPLAHQAVYGFLIGQHFYLSFLCLLTAMRFLLRRCLGIISQNQKFPGMLNWTLKAFLAIRKSKNFAQRFYCYQCFSAWADLKGWTVGYLRKNVFSYV